MPRQHWVPMPQLPRGGQSPRDQTQIQANTRVILSPLPEHASPCPHPDISSENRPLSGFPVFYVFCQTLAVDCEAVHSYS